MPWRTIGQNWPDNKELSLKFRVKLTLAPVSHWLCAVPRARRHQEEEGKESGKNGLFLPSPAYPRQGTCSEVRKQHPVPLGQVIGTGLRGN